jgi:flagellar hook-basal body complex protein FliE
MIEALQNVQGAEQLVRAYENREAGAAGTDFGGWLTQQIDALNQQITTGDMEVRKLALGEAGNLHEVMTRLEQAKLTFELAVQVRNKVLEAYQEVMRMSI